MFSDPSTTDATMKQCVRSALDGLLSQYQTATPATTDKYKETTLLGAEAIVSIASDWLIDTKRRCNQMAPIHRLPTEILQSIFQLFAPANLTYPEYSHPECYDPEYPRCVTIDYYSHLLALCNVSSRWARIIHGTPSFWIYTSSEGRQELTALALERSQNLPLWVGYYVTDSCSNEDLYRYLKTVLRASHRWHTFMICIYDDEYDFDCDLKRFIASRFTQLSRLLIFGGPHMRTASFPNYFKLGLPALKWVETDTFSLDWGGYQFNGLETFRLPALAQPSAVPLSQLLGILETSPALATFELLRTHIPEMPKQPPTPIPSPPLLDSLTLKDIRPSEAIRLLLPHLAVHKNSKLSLCASWTSNTVETEEAILTYASRHLSSLTQSTSCPATLHISFMPAILFEFNYGDGACLISLGTNDDTKNPIDWLKRLVLSLSAEQRSKPTTLDLTVDKPWMNQVMHIFDGCLNVVE
ncbi:hypothetical protein FRB99_005382 [Tulasnella sp. 403]|nr:hypothetical protein FRB99_005382 [Tulasnella sp. 403]